jgi:hypothetical protein
MSFTFRDFENILSAFQYYNYETVTFKEFDPEKEFQLLLRHDVDFCPENCLKIAEKEEKIGYKSTFFFLLTSDFYNPLSNVMQSLFKKLHDLGMSIGLHFDPSAQFNHFHQAIVRKILDNEFDVYSNHKPKTYGLTNYEGMFIKSAYDEQFAWKSKYMSDSNKEWKHGHPIQMLEQFEYEGRIGKNIQLVIHPIWYQENQIGDTICFNQLNDTTRDWRIIRTHQLQVKEKEKEENV